MSAALTVLTAVLAGASPPATALPQHPATVQGRVVSAIDGSPIAGAELTLQASWEGKTRSCATTRGLAVPRPIRPGRT